MAWGGVGRVSGTGAGGVVLGPAVQRANRLRKDSMAAS